MCTIVSRPREAEKHGDCLSLNCHSIPKAYFQSMPISPSQKFLESHRNITVPVDFRYLSHDSTPRTKRDDLESSRFSKGQAMSGNKAPQEQQDSYVLVTGANRYENYH